MGKNFTKSTGKKSLISIVLIILIIECIFIHFYNPPVQADSKKVTLDAPEVIHGQLDLNQLRIEEEGPIKLNGHWQFYWQELLTPEDLQKDNRMARPDLVTVPATWSHYDREGEPLPRYGFATYRMTILLNETETGQSFSFYMPSVATAYRLWVNGELVASNGVVGQSRDEMVPKNYAKIVTFDVEQTEIELLIQVSNFHQRKSGLWEAITFGTADQITGLRERNILFQIFVVGSIFIIGFYHVVLFFYRPQEKSPLYLAVTCFGIALRTLLLNDTLLIYLFPKIDWNIAVTLEYLAALIGLLFFQLFIRREFALDFFRRITDAFIVILIGYSLFVLFTPPRIFTNLYMPLLILVSLVMLNIVVISIIGVKHKRNGAYLNVAAILILFAAVLNDLFYYTNWIRTEELVSLGVLIFIFTQAVHLARRFSNSFKRVERLSRDLQELNRSLEQKVVLRTEELQKANRRLRKMERARRRLLASVSHELNTPLTFIQGYVKAMIDGVVSREDSTYLRAVYRDTQMMAHIIKDLQELSKLEAGQITFHYEELGIRSYIAQLYEAHIYMTKLKELHFKFVERFHDLDAEAQVICRVDPLRLKQVFLNFMLNAQKFTPPDGTITVTIDIPAPKDKKMVKVSVSDTGPGIAEKDIPYLFDRFFKVRDQGEVGERGAGLGLAIAKEIIEYHHGSVGVESEWGKGSLFYFTLPIQQVIEKKEGGSEAGEGKSISR